MASPLVRVVYVYEQFIRHHYIILSVLLTVEKWQLDGVLTDATTCVCVCMCVCVCVLTSLWENERKLRERRVFVFFFFFYRTARTQQLFLLNRTNESDSIKQFTAFALVHLIKALIGQLSLQRV